LLPLNHEKHAKAERETRVETKVGSKVDAHAADGERKRNNKEERANLVKTLPSCAFEGVWDGATYSMAYVPQVRDARAALPPQPPAARPSRH
jgi:hypothetical protein